MDSIDRRILWELDADCRQTYERLGQKLGLSANAIRKRVENLIDDGVIIRFMVVPHNAVIDADFISIIVYTDGTEDQDDLIKQMGNHQVIHHASPLVTNEGGAYHLFGQYSGIDMMSQLGQFLKEIEVVKEVKQYPVLFPRGEKIQLSNLQLRVLECVIEDPRMSISEISKCSGLSARMTRRALTQLQDSHAVRFTVRWDINAGDNTSFWILVNWNQKLLTHERVTERLHDEFPDDYWTAFVVATEPIVFARFVVDSLQRVNEITSIVKKLDYVESAQTLVCYSSHDFQWYGERLLKDMISNRDA
ncbi:MAG: winged helix-turn-helix transcriptional regulator [Candidatus Thorarchaeota archaeon]